jgi:hypothetical protein
MVVGRFGGGRGRGGFGVTDGLGEILFLEGFVDEIEGGGFHEANLVVNSRLGLEEVRADVGERGGAFGGNAIGGERLKEIAEDVIDVNLGEEIAGGRGMWLLYSPLSRPPKEAPRGIALSCGTDIPVCALGSLFSRLPVR